MPMDIIELEILIRQAFPNADVDVVDLAGDGDHYKARIISEDFRGLPRVAQHQLVYKALEGRVGEELHALALETSAPKS